MASLNPITGTLGVSQATHLLRRCTYNITVDRINQFKSLNINQALSALFPLTPPPYKYDEPVDQVGKNYLITNGQTDPSTNNTIGYVRTWWLDEAFNDESAYHKMEFFWHTKFTATYLRGGYDYLWNHLRLFRIFAFGNAKTLARKIITDPKMLLYLDASENKVGNPNENFAREFLELFTIEKGPQIGPGNYTNYTEHDVVQAARIFTGLRQKSQLSSGVFDNSTGLWAGGDKFQWHDSGNKTFSSAFNSHTITGGGTTADIYREIDEFVDMIFDQDETARAFVRRIYKYFVRTEITPTVEADIIVPLGIQLKNNNYEIRNTLLTLLSSEHFFDLDDSAQGDDHFGAIIKSPIELAFQMMSFFEMDPGTPYDANYQNLSQNTYTLYYNQTLQGYLFERNMSFEYLLPVTVAGYPAYYQGPDFSRHWFNSSTIAGRMKLGRMFITGQKSANGTGNMFIQMDPLLLFNHSHFSSLMYVANDFVTELCTLLFTKTPDQNRIDHFINDGLLNDGSNTSSWSIGWNNYIQTGSETYVRPRLEELLFVILGSFEYQLM
ncbi:MAG: DUF1800 domain-containing protein [Flavobacteriales bacterium]|nr:DUF1800 domain-containing protein [Flavobacteriales bacterium]